MQCSSNRNLAEYHTQSSCSTVQSEYWTLICVLMLLLLAGWLHRMTVMNVSSSQWVEEHGAASIMNNTVCVVSALGATYRCADTHYTTYPIAL
jgi:hypothetical protein